MVPALSVRPRACAWCTPLSRLNCRTLKVFFPFFECSSSFGGALQFVATNIFFFRCCSHRTAPPRHHLLHGRYQPTDLHSFALSLTFKCIKVVRGRMAKARKMREGFIGRDTSLDVGPPNNQPDRTFMATKKKPSTSWCVESHFIQGCIHC